MNFVSKNFSIGFLAGLLVLVTLIYANHFKNDFHFDDSHTVTNNPFIRDAKNIPLFFKDAGTFSNLPSNRSYRPVVTTSLAIDYALGKGYDPFWFHLSTFVMFLLLGICLFFFFRKLLTPFYDEGPSSLMAALATLWFMVHPVMAETVNYVIQRADLYSAFFVVLAFVMYQYSAFSRRFFLYLIPVVIGCLSKISTVMFAPIFLLYVWMIEEDRPLTDLVTAPGKLFGSGRVASVLLAFLCVAACYVFVGKMEPSWDPGGRDKWAYLMTQPFIISYYFSAFFLPIHLTADTDWGVFSSIAEPRAIFGLFFVAVFVTAMFLLSRQKKYRVISFGMAWFLLALIPTSSIVPLAEVMNDHRMFFPFVGLSVSVVNALYLGFDKLRSKFSSPADFRNSMVTLVLVLTAAYSYGTVERNKVWRTDESLWKDVTEKSPMNARGHMNFGLVLMGRADYAEAEKYFRKGLELWPYYGYLHVNMGILKEATSQPLEAEKYFADAIRYMPNNPSVYFYRGRFFQRQGRFTDAKKDLDEALRLNPTYLDAFMVMLDVQTGQKDLMGLKATAGKVLEIFPDNGRALTALAYAESGGLADGAWIDDQIKKLKDADALIELSLQLYNAGNYVKCTEAADAALKINPNSAQAYNNIGAAFGALKEWEKEIEYCSKALEIDPNFTVARNNLNWAKSQLNQK